MTGGALPEPEESPTPTEPSVTVRWEIILYFGILNIVLGLASPAGILGVPLLYFLKDNLHLEPLRLAIFVAFVSLPSYVSFVFGFIRDRWRPPMADRGYLLGAGLVAIAGYSWLASIPVSYYGLFLLILVAAIAFTIMSAAAQGFMTSVAQAELMTGRLSVVASFAIFVPAFISAIAGGWLVANLPPQAIFAVVASVTSIVLIPSIWPPAALAPFERAVPDRRSRSIAAIRRIIQHRPIWPAAAILFLWDVSPGWQTPMFYHLTEHVRISAAQFGAFTALQALFNLPSTLLYGWLCKQVPLRRLLWWGTWVAIAQGPVALFAQSATSAMYVAIAAGLFGGFATAAYIDLLMRACPKGLEGTGIMLAVAGVAIATRSGDVLGSWIYSQGGFLSAIVVTTIATALILPVLPTIPSNITASREGEPIPIDGLLSSS